ncbi:MAG: DUF3800 domain-containing protein [Pseudomonadota bacterium]
MSKSKRHVWGESSGSDAIRELVVGIAPSIARKRLLIPFQAYIDDSRDEGGTFVLAGHVATAEAWENFSREWEEALPMALLDERGHYFKMSEMASLDERLERVPVFWRIIEENVLFSLSCKIRIDDFRKAKERIVISHEVGQKPIDTNWGMWALPYTIAFQALLDGFNHNREIIDEELDPEQPIDFIFDEQLHEKKALLESWDAFIGSRKPEIRHRYGKTPIFRDDRDILPLQAADLWAWWVRKWYNEGRPDEMAKPDFGFWKAYREGHAKVAISLTEDQIVHGLLNVVSAHLPPGYVALDTDSSNGIRVRLGPGKNWKLAVGESD